jgi:hypothetical protein
MKCLEEKRDRRYDTANALARDIQRYLADEPVEARPPSAGYRLSKFLRRNRGAAIAAALGQDSKLWDLATGKELRTFTGHSDSVNNVAFAPDGRTALPGSEDKNLKLWDLATGWELRTFAGYAENETRAGIAPNGRAVLSGSHDKTLKLWDFTRGVARRAFEPRVAAAQARLQQAAGDPVALATLGEWYAFRGMDHWAVEFLGRARERGASVAPLTLARCYWNLNCNGDARREFQIALEQSTNPGEATYLRWCIQAIDTEPERKRQQEAAEKLIRRANRANALAQAGRDSPWDGLPIRSTITRTRVFFNPPVICWGNTFKPRTRTTLGPPARRAPPGRSPHHWAKRPCRKSNPIPRSRNRQGLAAARRSYHRAGDARRPAWWSHR